MQKLVGYKVNIEILVIFLHTNRKYLKKKQKNPNHYNIKNKQKYLGMNLIKEVTLKLMTMREEIKEDIGKVSWFHG